MRTHGESQLFGDGTDLPGPELLDGFDFRRNTLEGSFCIASNPDFHDHVVRVEAIPHNSDLPNMARQGIRHFRTMTDAGLVIPNQRFVIASGVHSDEPALYAITDRIDGRTLTSDPEDAAIARPVITGLATYTSWVLKDQENLYLWDKFLSWQFTVKPNNQAVMHDVGLDFQPARNGNKPSNDLYLGAVGLEDWARNAGLETSRELRTLLRQVESLPRRAVRRLMTTIVG